MSLPLPTESCWPPSVLIRLFNLKLINLLGWLWSPLLKKSLKIEEIFSSGEWLRQSTSQKDDDSPFIKSYQNLIVRIITGQWLEGVTPSCWSQSFARSIIFPFKAILFPTLFTWQTHHLRCSSSSVLSTRPSLAPLPNLEFNYFPLTPPSF